MTSYVVMESATDPGGEPEFVRDRFSVLAFIAPVIWLLWYRLWIEAFAALAAAIALAALGTVAGFEETAPLLSLLVSVYVAAEGPQLRILALERRGWRHVATVEAGNLLVAELRYLAGNMAAAPVAMPPQDSSLAEQPIAPRPTAVSGPALGLLDYPGGR